ncbi:hypothetical protein [Paenibacillus humicola]|uniref:hypothetical protein n=1 Tax=Paenibacillus humicola TaxID=3110540 RepID=UPI00237AA5B3|nr:hypothetical protein [Paenibacillus humicola]
MTIGEKRVKAAWGGGGHPYGYFGGAETAPEMTSPGMASPGHKSHDAKKPTRGTRGTQGSRGGKKDYLDALVGTLVKINRGGPDSVQGRLVAVHKGYTVLSTSNGTVYINSYHVKSITQVEKKKSRGRKQSHHYIMADSFEGVLHKLVKQFAQINWGGPERMDGFIAEVGGDSLLLIVNNEFVRIPLQHIRTIKHSGKYASNGSQGSRGSKGSKGDNSGGGSKSGGSKSDGSKSGGSHGSSGNKGKSSKASARGETSKKTKRSAFSRRLGKK